MKWLDALLLASTVVIAMGAGWAQLQQPAKAVRPRFSLAIEAGHLVGIHPWTDKVIGTTAPIEIGSPVTVVVALTNKSNKWIGFSREGGEVIDDVASYPEFDVRDAQGTAVAFTKRWQAFLDRDPSVMMTIPMEGGNTPTLDPGETWKHEFNLSERYDFSKPGTYTIRVQKLDLISKIVVKSNTVKVTVTE